MEFIHLFSIIVDTTICFLVKKLENLQKNSLLVVLATIQKPIKVHILTKFDVLK